MLRRTAIRVTAALAALLIPASCANTGADEQTRSAGQVGYPEVPRNLTRVAPDQRKELPIVSGPALGSNQTISTHDYRGRVVVINVWGSWCPPCRKEAPDLQEASVQTRTSPSSSASQARTTIRRRLRRSFELQDHLSQHLRSDRESAPGIRRRPRRARSRRP